MSRPSNEERIAKYIVDYPGITAAEIAVALDLSDMDVQMHIRRHIDDGHVKVATKKVLGSVPINSYFASQSLVNAVDGVQQIVKHHDRSPTSTSELGDDAFSCGFFTDGRLSIAKQRKSIELTPEEARRLNAFLDSINIDRITGAAQ